MVFVFKGIDQISLSIDPDKIDPTTDDTDVTDESQWATGNFSKMTQEVGELHS